MPRIARALLLLPLACTPGEPRERPPEVAVQPAPPGGAAPSPSAPPASSTPSKADPKSWKAGERVVARGKVSRTPWQHMMTTVDGKKSEYFDLEDGWQTVIYASDLPACAGLVEVDATVIKVSGPSKRPGEETKLGDTYQELQLDVSMAHCVK